jgi:hypothetical protein
VAAFAVMSRVAEGTVERQVRAFNDHDVDGFLACYAIDAILEDADGKVLIDGRERMRDHYDRIFHSLPDLNAEIVSRICVGAYVIYEERVTGRPEGELRSVAIYRIDGDGLIDRVRFLR